MARYGDGSPAIDADAAWLALARRDERLDGSLYVGVTSTGVYCRPVCRVRTPRRENCRFFAGAAEAEAAGFRACLKCRPAAAPGALPTWSAMDASRTLAREAARWLDENFAAAPPEGRNAGTAAAPRAQVARLAAHLGVSERHLRRIFVAAHGVAPLAWAQARRLALAERLLTETTLPVAQVALASGYASLRRFNAAFAARHGVGPARLRRDAQAAGTHVAAVQTAPAEQRPAQRDAVSPYRPVSRQTPSAVATASASVSTATSATAASPAPASPAATAAEVTAARPAAVPVTATDTVRGAPRTGGPTALPRSAAAPSHLPGTAP